MLSRDVGCSASIPIGTTRAGVPSVRGRHDIHHVLLNQSTISEDPRISALQQASPSPRNRKLLRHCATSPETRRCTTSFSHCRHCVVCLGVARPRFKCQRPPLSTIRFSDRYEFATTHCDSVFCRRTDFARPHFTRGDGTDRISSNPRQTFNRNHNAFPIRQALGRQARR